MKGKCLRDIGVDPGTDVAIKIVEPPEYTVF